MPPTIRRAIRQRGLQSNGWFADASVVRFIQPHYTISIGLKSLPTSTRFGAMMKPLTLRAIQQIPTPALGEFEKRRNGVASSACMNHEAIARVFTSNVEFE